MLSGMSYSVREVSAMLGLSPSRIRAWSSEGLLEPERGERGELRFGFRDLIVLRTAGELAASKISQKKVRRILERLREQLPAGRSLTGVRITADGERVVVRDGSSVWNPESGQALFDFSVEEIAARTEPFLRSMTERARSRSAEMSANDWYQLACDVELTSIAEARDAYERALQADSAHADAHVNLGRLLHEEGAPEAAAKHYRAALRADPDHDTAAFNLGVALEDLGRLADAIEAYRRALDLDPANAEAHYNLAGIYERKGDKRAALRHLKAYRTLAG
jgi:tetratricopeptide (TPR) repeat protein